VLKSNVALPWGLAEFGEGTGCAGGGRVEGGRRAFKARVP
jgi:hypothetical protein